MSPLDADDFEAKGVDVVRAKGRHDAARGRPDGNAAEARHRGRVRTPPSSGAVGLVL